MRVMIKDDPFKPTKLSSKGPWDWFWRGLWPAFWVSHPKAPAAPFAAAYKLQFELDENISLRVHCSADERYELFLDGRRIGWGSERGDVSHWFYETREIPLSKGPHVFVARVWSMGLLSPLAQLSLKHGFIFASEEPFSEKFNTGKAKWESKILGGYKFMESPVLWGTGARLEIDGKSFDWGFENGEGGGWEAAVHDEKFAEGCDGATRNEYGPCRLMLPARLPAMLEECKSVGKALLAESASKEDWHAMLQGGSALEIPPNKSLSVLIDLENYYCAYPELLVSGGSGSQIEILWAEALFNEPEGKTKGNRDAFEGKYFIGYGDTFRPDGGQKRLFETLWWRAGRYLKVNVLSGAEPLRLERLQIRETRYPMEMQSRFDSDEPRLQRFIPIGLRGLQMCSHETYMDCPYYEQLMYDGDTRLEILTTYTLTHDSRLPMKALEIFGASRLASGLTQSRYPSRITQLIPPFALWWVAMLHDFALWRGDKDFIRGLAPVMRSVLEAFLGFRNSDGLVEGPIGWNFMDWVPDWPGGVPPEGEFGVSGLINWQFVGVLEKASELETWLGEKEMASRWRHLAEDLAAKVSKNFWNQKKGLFSEDLRQRRYSEHSQCLALLSGHLDAKRKRAIAKNLPTAKGLDQTTIYFTHYLFETYAVLGRMDKFFERMELWYEHEKLGMKTTMEAPEPTRSDCHAWGAHPLYHYFATLLGIRPASFGFDEIVIRPQLGPLKRASGKLVHPKGFIEADFEVKKGKLAGSISLPKGTKGIFVHAGKKKVLKAGRQSI
jgi:hypothetical protein